MNGSLKTSVNTATRYTAIPPLRASRESHVINLRKALSGTDDVSIFETGPVSVSGYGLERYLNACTPTCHG